METKRCAKCGRELPLSAYKMSKYGKLQAVCRDCVKAKVRETRSQNNQSCAGGDDHTCTDPELDGKTNREVMDIMVRCKRWLEARGCTIHLSGEYTEVKKLKF